MDDRTAHLLCGSISMSLPFRRLIFQWLQYCDRFVIYHYYNYLLITGTFWSSTALVSIVSHRCHWKAIAEVKLGHFNVCLPLLSLCGDQSRIPLFRTLQWSAWFLKNRFFTSQSNCILSSIIESWLCFVPIVNAYDLLVKMGPLLATILVILKSCCLSDLFLELYLSLALLDFIPWKLQQMCFEVVSLLQPAFI